MWQNATSTHDRISQKTRNRRELPQTGKRHPRRTYSQSVRSGKRQNACVTISGARRGGPLTRFLCDVVLELLAGEMRSEQHTPYVGERKEACLWAQAA